MGACAALDEDRIAVLEHGKEKNHAYQIDIWIVDLSRGADIHLEPDPDSLGRIVGGRTLEELAVDSAAFAAVFAPAGKTLLAGDVYTYTAWPTTKPEGLAVVDDSTVALASDNDFGVQSVGGDGIPHVMDPDQRRPVVMYLRTRSLGLSGSGMAPRNPVRFRLSVAWRPGGWDILAPGVGEVRVLGPSGTLLRTLPVHEGRTFLDARGSPRGVLILDAGSAGRALLPVAR